MKYINLFIIYYKKKKNTAVKNTSNKNNSLTNNSNSNENETCITKTAISKEQSNLFKTISKSRTILKKSIDGKLQPIILGCILLNTLSMAIEHHDQVFINNLINLCLILLYFVA